ncbi:MAG: rhodanese-like domain-containing protein, partial [Verrucomicrobiales bacterium]
MSEETKIGPDTAMSQVLDYYPGAQRALFAKYHIGGCASCGFRPDETLGGVCERNENIPVDEAMAHIAESHANDLARQV